MVKKKGRRYKYKKIGTRNGTQLKILKKLEYYVKVYTKVPASLEVNCLLGKYNWSKLTLENRKAPWTHVMKIIIKAVKNMPLKHRTGTRLFYRRVPPNLHPTDKANMMQPT